MQSQVQGSRSFAPMPKRARAGAASERSSTMYGQERRVALLVVILLLLFSVSDPAHAATAGFKQAVTYPVGTAPVAVASGDFNGDGKADLAVANNGNAAAGHDGNVSILLGNGDGTVQPANDFTAGKNPFAIAAADF